MFDANAGDFLIINQYRTYHGIADHLNSLVKVVGIMRPAGILGNHRVINV
jgi:hypothetical protein